MGTQTAISIELEGIGRILFNRELSVPIYQRSYAWEDEHIKDLFNDISTAIENGETEYFIGSIVTTKNKSSRAEVADGQQRLATITIFIAAIRDYFFSIGDFERASTITAELLNRKDLKTLNLIPKLRLNEIDNEYFENRVLLYPNEPKRKTLFTKPSHKRIDHAANVAREHIEKIAGGRKATDQLTDLIDYLKDCVRVIWVRVPDDTNAFMVFETLNDRGLDLAISDLLKNHLFGLGDTRLSEIQHSWSNMLGALDGIDEENILLMYLRHYWSSKYGLTREKELYGDIKKRINNTTKAVAFAGELEQNAHLYNGIVNTTNGIWSKYGDSVRQHMDTINNLRMVQVRPLILAILDNFDAAEIKNAIKCLVSWSVRFLVHGGLGGGAIEIQNCAAAKDIREGSIKTAASLLKSMIKVLPNDMQFKASFSTVTVSKTFLARYYLQALEQTIRGDSNPELVPNMNSEIVSLEHILPQNASKSWAYIPAEEQTLLLKRLGNMALMQSHSNSNAGNDSFSKKKSIYAKSEYRLTSMLDKEKKWDRLSIEKRQKHLSELAIKMWPLK